MPPVREVTQWLVSSSLNTFFPWLPEHPNCPRPGGSSYLISASSIDPSLPLPPKPPALSRLPSAFTSVIAASCLPPFLPCIHSHHSSHSSAVRVREVLLKTLQGLPSHLKQEPVIAMSCQVIVTDRSWVLSPVIFHLPYQWQPCWPPPCSVACTHQATLNPETLSSFLLEFYSQMLPRQTPFLTTHRSRSVKPL